MKYLSLFSGIGGFELGIQQAYENLANQYERPNVHQGHSGDNQGRCKQELPTCIGYSEIDKYATQIYSKHFNHKNYGDITKINADELPGFDFLCGGFPCQSFSIAGKRRGFADTRGTLFFYIARILQSKKPQLFLLENVKGLLSHDNGKTFGTIIATLDELGYDLQWQVLNSKDFGVPQNRERVFIVGHLRGTPRPQVFPLSGEGETTLGESRAIAMRNKRRIATITKQVNTLSSSFRGHPDGDGRPAIIQNMKIRRLTPKECERLQGFPDDWTEVGMEYPKEEYYKGEHKILAREIKISDTQRYKCLGNAVSVPVIKAICEKLFHSLLTK